MPNSGALSLLQKPLYYRGIERNSCTALCVLGLGPVVARARVLVHEVFDRDPQAAARGGARCASQELGRGTQAGARGAAHCASQVLDRCTRPLTALPHVVRRRYLIVVPMPLPAAALVVRGKAVFIYRGAQSVARDGARCASQALDRCARPLPAAPRR